MMFAYSLARLLGMTVGDMLNRMTSLEFESWKAYFNILEKGTGQDELTRTAEQIMRDRKARAKRR